MVLSKLYSLVEKYTAGQPLFRKGKKVKVYLLLFLVLLVIFAVQSYNMKKTAGEKLKKDLDERWGKRQKRTYTHSEYGRVSHYYCQTVKPEDYVIDDITWNDLDMDDIFRALNHTCSSVGEESLYRRLRIPEKDEDVLKKFGTMAEVFEKNPEAAKELQQIYAAVGRTKSVSLYDFIVTASELKPKSNGKHYVGMALILTCAAGLFVVPVYAAPGLLAVLSYNIYSYYKEKNDVNNYFVCFEYIIRLISRGGQIKKQLEEIRHPVYRDYVDKITELLSKTKNMKKGMFLISSPGVNDSVVEMVMQYVRMIFHVDLIKFNAMVKKTKENLPEIDELYRIAGDVEAAVAVASFRTCLQEEYGYYAIPEWRTRGGITFENIYHPLIEKAVTNSMHPERNVLLTGSNASGKSTFLKTVAINAVLAQTIYTAAAQKFAMPMTEVCSSMALRDNLSQRDSYYMAEIKSLKRIMDKAEEGKHVLCFIDEVLRGTNTIERIAASSEILKALKLENVICFAATHDIELTYILEEIYANYHFEEEVSGDDVKFNYKLKKGRTVTRNAIRLLKVLGYPGQIISGASAMVEEFAKTGKWASP